MRLFLYYALHSVKNQLKKLFKTWVLIFLLACMVIGGLIGAGAAKLSDLAESQDEPGAVEIIDGGEDPYDGGEIPDDVIFDDGETMEGAEFTRHIVELIAGAVVLGVLIFNAVSADKNGSRIFLPADVNLLFAAPMRPQSVLLFRLMTQLGVAIFASIYLLFQLPNLMLNLGLSLWAALAVIATWCGTIAVGKLVQTLLYTVCSTHPGAKKYIRRGVYVLLVLIAAGYYAFYKSSGTGYFEAATRFFNAPVTRYIPVWGWLKGITMYAMEGSAPGALVCLAATVLSCAALLFIIRRIKADFYEDAMAKSEETAELLERAQSEKSSGLVFRKRKKDRSDRLRRDGMRHGAGASVFFWKSLYNRFRFGHLGYFTKTAETYLAAAVGTALLCRLVIGTESLIPTVCVLAVFAFYRTLGNPLSQDTKMDFFRMVPESTWAKLFYSLLGGTANCLLDLLPAMIAAVLILRAEPLTALFWLLFILSVDFYATNVGTFIDLSVPVSAGKTVKQIVQIMFIYFGLLPDVAILAVAMVLDRTAAGVAIAAALNVVLGLLFFFLSPLFLTPRSGRTGTVTALGEDTRRIVGRHFSRMGLGTVSILLVASAVQIVLGLVLQGSLQNTSWGMWVVTFAPMYLAGVPAGLLIIRRVPFMPLEKGKLGPGRYAVIILISIFMMYAGNLVGIAIQSLVEKLVGFVPGNPLDDYVTGDSLVLQILFMVILAPLIEEFIFRKTLIDRMHPYGEKLAVVTTAAMFGLFHGNLSQMFYAFTLGLVFGYVYLRTGKLRYTVGLHMLINLLGGVVGPELSEWAASSSEGLRGLEGMELADLAGVDLSELMNPGAIALGLYSLVMIGCAVAGLVLLCVRSRRVTFRPAPLELGRGQRFRTAWLNPGMILFAAICLIMVVTTFLT